MIADRHEVVERLVVEVRVDVERLLFGEHHGQPLWGDRHRLRPLDLRTTASQQCAAVPRRARI